MMKKALSLILCLSMLLSMIVIPSVAAEEKAETKAAYAVQEEFEIVGDWVWGETVANLGAAKIVDRSARMGVTDLYMLAKGTGGKLSYLKTQYKDALTRTDRDVLQELITAAHAKGIRVHAWLVTVEDEYYKSKHPEAGVYHYVRGQDNNRLNPYDPGYQTYMTNIVTEIASGYDIDGIHLDYIRYNHVANGWSETDFANIAAMGANVEQVKYMINKTFYQDKLPAGETVDENYLFDAYRNGDPTALLIGRYRCDNIANFATKLRDAAKAAKPDILFTGALMPEGGVTYGKEDIAFGDLHYGQNYKDAAKIYDYVCPMAYSASYEAEPQWMADIATYCVENGVDVVMGLQSFSPLTTTRLMADIEAVRALLPMEGVLGIAHFRHTQYSYAKTGYNYNTGVMEIEVINASESTGYKWVKVDVPAGMKITKLTNVSGFKSGTISISSDGRTATIGYSESSSSTTLGALGEGKLRVQFTGKPTDENVRPSLVRAYLGSGETRVYNVYEDLTNFKVNFVDYDGTVLATKTVVPGGSVEAPSDPLRYGYVFAGWDKSFDVVNSDLTVTATYEKIQVAGEFEIVGDWVWGEDVYNLGAQTIVDRSVKYGVTDLYMLAKGTGGKLSYLKTQYTDARARTDRDVLQELITAAHAKGIRVHTWLVTVEDAYYKSKHPEAGVYHYVRGTDNDRINPYDADYRTYMSNIVKEIVTGYDVDGVHLDYIRYNHLANGWGEQDFARIAAMGADVEQVKYMINKTFYQDQLPEGETIDDRYVFNAYKNGDPTALLIAQYRRDNINDFAKLLRDTAKAADPDIIFTGALMPEGGVTYGTEDISFGDLHYGQNYTDAAEIYDYICPMAYSASYEAEPQWMADIAEYSVKVGNKVVMGLQSFYPLTSVNLMGDINAVRGLLPMEGVLGIAHFRHSQFSYSKAVYDYNTGKMDIDFLNASSAAGCKWLIVEVPEGMKITKATLGTGFTSGAPVSIAADGRSVTFGYSETSSSELIGALKSGKLTINFTGKPVDEKERPSLVRIYLTKESRVYNTTKDHTTYTVTFKDSDGTVLASKKTYAGGTVLAPEAPAKEGCTFAGWDKSFDAVTENITVTATYASLGSKEFEIVGEWVWGEDIYNLGAETVIGRAVQNGVTDLYLLVKGTGGKLSFLNTRYTEALSRTDRDVLQECLDVAHAANIRVHAWIVTVEDSNYKANNPEAGIYHYIRARDNDRINPYDAGYRTYMTNLITDLVSNYDIDGLHLDYIRYNHLCNGWSDVDFANLAAMGANVENIKYMINKTFYADKLPAGESVDSNYIFRLLANGDKDATLVAQYRRNNIVDFAKLLVNTAEAINPNLIFSAAVMPEGGVAGGSAGSANAGYADLHYGQNYTDAAGIYDYIAPMAYTASYGTGPQWFAGIAEYAAKVGNGVVMGTQSYYPSVSADLMAEIEATRALLPMEGVLGIVHFRHSQFSYMNFATDMAAGEIDVHAINTYANGGANWLRIEATQGVTFTGAQYLNGFNANAPIEIAPDGSYILFGYSDISGTVLPALSEGDLRITFTGKPVDPNGRIAIGRIYIVTNESRAYSSYSERCNHAWGVGTCALDATCTRNGAMVYSCNLCGEYKVEAIEATGHTVIYTAKDAESHAITCANCDLNEMQVHDFSGGACICGEEDKILVDTGLKIGHTLNLASDISVNYAISMSLLGAYDLDTAYMEVEVDKYEGNTKVGYDVYKLTGEEKGGYYYFTLSGLTAVHMNNELRATFYGRKDSRTYSSAVDVYSIAQYAYSQLNKTGVIEGLQPLCANLLRYGASAQIFKGYRTDALADAKMTAAHKELLTDLSTVTFGNTSLELGFTPNPTVTWAGKALDLQSKVGIRYVVNLSNYKGKVEDLKLYISYSDITGAMRTVVLGAPELYKANDNLYAFTFDGLLAAELRTEVTATVYENDTPVSNDFIYCADTYGNGKTGTLGELCKALFAYSDSAKAYFAK